ncbi:hypothetical protein BGZ97_007569, partial [Linnemannia gamsii]
MANTEKCTFFNFVDKKTASSQNTSSRKEPDMVLELKDASNKTICNLAFGEATSHAQQTQHKKNAIDHEGAKRHMPLRKELGSFSIFEGDPSQDIEDKDEDSVILVPSPRLSARSASINEDAAVSVSSKKPQSVHDSTKAQRTEAESETAAEDTKSDAAVEDEESDTAVEDAKVALNPTMNLAHFETLNQATSWICEVVDLVIKFRDVRPGNMGPFSLVRDGIADMTHGSSFTMTLPSDILTEARKVPAIPDINAKWPTLQGISERVFKYNTYEGIATAIKKEDMTDPIAAYMFSVVMAYSHYFDFHSEIPKDLNEREGFTDLTWSFIRGALTMNKIESRHLEVLVTGVQDRKNHDRDPFFDTMEVGQYCDGLAFSGRDQIFLAEASQIYNTKALHVHLCRDRDPQEALSSSTAYFNLAVKQKAVYQPVFRFRRWLEQERSLVPEKQEESIHHLESHLPPLRGQSASVIEYARELEEMEERLKSFYSGDDNRFKRHKWDMNRAKQVEYQLMAERLLNIVGGSLGRRIEDNKNQDPILIGVGL